MKGKMKLKQNSFLLLVTILLFFIMYGIGCVLFNAQGFSKTQNFLNLFISNAGLIVIGIGMTVVMITGGIDISVGSFVAMGCMMLAWMMEKGGIGAVPAVIIVLVTGIVFGLVQGFLVAYMDIQPFIVTLAGMFFARGMTSIVHTDPFNVQNEAFVKLKDTRVIVPGMGSVNRIGKYVNAYVEIGVIVAILIVVIMFVMLRWTKLGRSFYAVGGNRQSALMLGINVKKTRFLAHLLSGLLAGIAGYVYFLHVGSGAATHASGMEMNAIASSIIGGTLLTGGVGNIIGTFFGVLSLSTIQNIVSSAGLDQAWWTGITIAAMLCLFLVIQSVVLARKKRK